MLENISPDGLGQLNLVAGVFLAAGFLLITIGLVTSGLRLAGGKLGASSGESGKGMRGLVLSAAGAAVLGSIGGAIQWSSTAERTGGLMPDAAQPRDVTVEHQAPLISCDSSAVLEAEAWDNTAVIENREVAHSEHGEVVAVLNANGVYDQLIETMVDEETLWAGNYGMEIEGQEHAEQLLGQELFLARAAWHPHDSDDGCDNSNVTAGPGSTITVNLWSNGGTMESAGQIGDDIELTVSEDREPDAPDPDGTWSETDEEALAVEFHGDLFTGEGVEAGESYTGTVSVENTSDSEIASGELEVEIPTHAHVTDIGRADDCDWVDEEGKDFVCPVASFDAGQTRSIDITVQADESDATNSVPREWIVPHVELRSS